MLIFLIYSSAVWVSEFKSSLHVISDEMKHHGSDNEHALWLSCYYSAVKKKFHIQKFYMCYSYFNVALFSCYFVPWYKALSVSILLNDSEGFSTMFDE
jgi:hypothetical protein